VALYRIIVSADVSALYSAHRNVGSRGGWLEPAAGGAFRIVRGGIAEACRLPGKNPGKCYWRKLIVLEKAFLEGLVLSRVMVLKEEMNCVSYICSRNASS